MKNKKLFAILTLVCFMFTLMPVAAFANDAYVTVNSEETDTVYVNEVVNVAVSTGSAYRFFAVNNAGELDQIANANATTMSFDDVDTYKVYALAEGDASAIASATMSKADKLALLMEADSLVDDYAVVKVKARSLDYRITLAAKDGSNVAAVRDDQNAVIPGKYTMSIAADGGWNELGNVVATLQKTTDGTTWNDVKGEELTFTTVGYVDVVTEDGKTTDRGGDVEFEVVSERTGDYKVIVKYGAKAKAELAVSVTTADVANVQVVNAPTAPIALDQDAQATDIEFKFTDASGNAIEADVDNTAEVKVAVTAKPADSTVETFTLVKETTEAPAEDPENDEAGVYTLAGGFDEEGEYTIKVALKNGKSASVTVKVLEQGEIVGIKYDVMNTPVTVAYDATTFVDKVLAFDANGVTSVAQDVTFSATGKAIESFNAATAELTTKDKEELIGTEITVMAKSGDLVATTTLTVVDKAATIKYDALNAEVGINNVFVGSVVDGEEKGSSIAGYSPVADAIVLDKPADAVAVVDATMTSKGKVELSFLASEVGEYKVQTVVTYTVAGTTYYVTSIDTVTVGAGAGTYDDIVVMSIGANKIVVNSEVKVIDAAPIIENNRTFVPFRALAEAFGATVAFDEATQSVTAELNGTTVVMTIGSAEYTVNGVAKTADVAPFINGSRTMVPVRFVAEAFGINVTPVYGDNGATVDVLFAK